MKNLMIVTILAISTMSATGCCRAWNNWFGNDAECSDYSTYSGMPMMDGLPMYDGMPVYDGSMLMAPTAAQTLPGPAKAN